MTSSLKASIHSIFNKSQHSAADHPKLVKSLRKVYGQCNDQEEFLTIFIDCLKRVLIHGERESSVNFCLDFAAKFAASFEVGNEDSEESCHPFYMGLFQFLLKNHNVKSQAVRFRVCQFINRIFDDLSESASINADLFDEIYDAMLERIQDRIASVRVQAVIALQRLQDPSNKECPIIKALVFHLERDPHPEVRRSVLKSLGCNYFTLDFVMERLRDVKDTVRRQAYVFISERVHVRSLSIANRVKILKYGLNDRSPNVKAVVTDKLIPAWVASMDGSFFTLLRGLDVEGCSDIASDVLNVWFRTLNHKEITSILKLNEDRLVLLETLKPEVAIYWRTAVEFLHKEGVHANDELETILPEMTAFGNYVNQYVTTQLKELTDMEVLSMEFIVSQLLQIAPFFDLADEAGRLNLRSDLCELLQMDATSPTLTRTMVKCISVIEPNLDARTFKLLEVISELREPLTQAEIPLSEEQQRKNKLEVAQVRVQLNELKDELEQAVKDQNFVVAQEIQKSMAELEEKLKSLASRPAQYDVEVFREERNDPLTLLKCLSVVCELLKNAQMLKLTKELQELASSLILPCVEREDPAVRNAAFEALGILCTCDRELAQQRLLLFVQAVQMDHTVLQVTTAKVLFDLVQLFGLDSFEDKENGMSLATVLTELLDSEDSDVQTIAVEGFTKLMISSRIESPMILSRLVIFLFHPLTVDNVRLRQVLNVFMPFYASLDIGNQQQLEAAFLPTIKTIQKAPVTSPLADIDVGSVVKLFVDLTREELLNKKAEVEHNIHDMLALKLCSEALRNPDSGESKAYLKALAQLNLTFSNPSHTRDLSTLTQKLLRAMKDKNGIKIVVQFHDEIVKHLVAEDSVVNDTQSSTTSFSQSRPKNRQLLSKSGATLLMDVKDDAASTESDAEMSQGSTDVFQSPASTKQESSEELVIQIDSSSSNSTGKERCHSKEKEQFISEISTLCSVEESDEEIMPSSPPKRTTRARRTAK